MVMPFLTIISVTKDSAAGCEWLTVAPERLATAERFRRRFDDTFTLELHRRALTASYAEMIAEQGGVR